MFSLHEKEPASHQKLAAANLVKAYVNCGFEENWEVSLLWDTGKGDTLGHVALPEVSFPLHTSSSPQGCSDHSSTLWEDEK